MARFVQGKKDGASRYLTTNQHLATIESEFKNGYCKKHIKDVTIDSKRHTYSVAMEEPPIDSVRVPKGINPGLNAYAVLAKGECLLSEYKSGDVIVCDPDQLPEPGDFVAI